jgi:predicted TIM-barrel fold metal-dependent hydrolase
MHSTYNIFVGTLFLIFSGCSTTQRSTTFYSAEDFSKIAKTDAHVHIHTRDSFLILQAEADNIRLFTINYDDVNESPTMQVQEQFARFLITTFPRYVSYATTISIRNFSNTNWLEETLAYVDSTVKRGAKAVKIYKVIGMSLRDKEGKLVMIDDARFDPMFAHFEKNNIPVVGHLAEPRNCWLPVEQMTVKGDASYFSQHPEYHMYKHPEMPTYEDQIRARDNMLAKHPRLTFVGAHLGSLEYNVDSLAARLDRFPNMAVDMAARIVHLQLQARDNWQKVHDFLVKYNDRLLYATDLFVDESSDTAQARTSAHETWVSDWKFFATDESMTSTQFDGSFKGLRLPKDVIDNIYFRNARKWLKIF